MAEVSQTATITTPAGDAGAAAVGDGSAAYVFQAPPRPVDTGPRRKYRDPAEAPKRPNLMQDRRVVRGNTYAALIPTMTQRKMMETQLNAADARRTARLRTAKSRDVVSGPQDPAAVEGREHRNVQTDDFLEELADKVFEADVSTQTDSIDDRPPPPVFVPKPRGVDKFTKIEEGELFDFDLSVQPILEVLVGKTLDQGLQEVLEEEELKRLEYTRWGFEQKRDQLIAEAQRLEEATRRRYEEKERRMVQERARVVQERVVAQKLAAQTAARGYLAGLHTSVLEQLGKSGTFFDPVVKQVETEFLPWLITKVVHEMEQVDACQAEVDAMVTKAVQGLIKQRDDKIAADRLAAELEAKRLQDEADARAAAAAEVARKQAEERAAQQARVEELKRQLDELKAKELAEAEAEAEEDGEGDDVDEPAPRPGRSHPPVSNGTPLSSVPDDEV